MSIPLLVLATALQAAASQATPSQEPAPVSPLTVSATCDPCTVEAGRSSTIRADATHAEGHALTYRWTASGGVVGDPASRQARWTAPRSPGTVRLTVTVDDGRGLAVDATMAVQVVAPRPYTFEELTFERNRVTLGPTALRVLGDIAEALRAERTLSLQISGLSCAVVTGDPSTLGQRRAAAVQTFLTDARVPAAQLTTLSCGDADGPVAAGKDELRVATRRVTFITSRPGP